MLLGRIFPRAQPARDAALLLSLSLPAQVTTVGYGDVIPATDGGKVFTSLWLLVAVVVVARAIGSVVDYVIEAKERRELVKRLTMPMNLDEIRMADGDGDGTLLRSPRRALAGLAPPRHSPCLRRRKAAEALTPQHAPRTALGTGLIDRNEFIIWTLMYRKLVDKSTVVSSPASHALRALPTTRPNRGCLLRGLNSKPHTRAHFAGVDLDDFRRA